MNECNIKRRENASKQLLEKTSLGIIKTYDRDASEITMMERQAKRRKIGNTTESYSNNDFILDSAVIVEHPFSFLEMYTRGASSENKLSAFRGNIFSPIIP